MICCVKTCNYRDNQLSFTIDDEMEAEINRLLQGGDNSDAILHIDENAKPLSDNLNAYIVYFLITEIWKNLWIK